MAKRPKRPKPSERAETNQPDTPQPNPPKPNTRKRRGGHRPTKALLAAQSEAAQAERIAPNKNEWQPNARDLEVYAGYVEGEKTQRQIAAEYSMAVSSINDIIRKVETYLASKNMMQIRELRARATERLELLFAWAVQSYRKSLEDEVTITVEEGKETSKTSERRRGQAGSAAFLAQAREAMSDLLDVWGAKAPKSLSLEVNEGVRVGGLSTKEAINTRIQRLQELAVSHVDSE